MGTHTCRGRRRRRAGRTQTGPCGVRHGGIRGITWQTSRRGAHGGGGDLPSGGYGTASYGTAGEVRSIDHRV